MPNSIRWRLPASYGAIAFLTIISLGGALLLMLNSYYHKEERRYLEQNAQAVSEMLSGLMDGPVLDPGVHKNLLLSQIDSLAYLTQSRIQLLDNSGDLVVDSGSPQTLRVASTLSLKIDLEEGGESVTQSIGRTSGDEGYTTALIIENEGGRFEAQTTVSGSLVEPAGGINDQAMTLAGLQAPITLDLAEETAYRSAELLQQPITNLDGQTLGQVILSEGPAFGRSILYSVTRGLLLAGIVAVVVASLVGYLISRQLTQPVLALVQVTEQMSAGKLDARANLSGDDELGQLARSFNKMASRIEVTVATLKHFVADAAHEMNTPLTALLTQLELAARNHPEDPLLSQAISQAGRLENLNNDLLQLSRLEGGIGLGDFEPINLHSLLGRSGEVYAAQAEQAGLILTPELKAQPIFVQGDKELLTRAVDNLIDNAIKFTQEDGQITLSLGSEGSWAVISVIDSGIGIEEEDLSLIFDRFHRGRNAAGFPGSGLGLAITHSIIEVHGGQLEVRSQPGRTEIQIFLPVIQTG